LEILEQRALLAANALDTTWGGTGKVVTDFGPRDGAADVAIQYDGKIVVAGGDSGGQQSIHLARYNLDGTLDNTFGSGGKVTTDFFSGGVDSAEAIALQMDGKIVVTGTAGGNGFSVIRYNSNGTLDSTFGQGGLAFAKALGVQGKFNDVSIADDGKIVLVGEQNLQATHHDFVVTRLNPNGSLDLTFGNGGSVTTDFGLDEGAYAVTLQDNGKIVVSGTASIATGGHNFALARYNVNGSLDTSFNFTGKAVTAFPSPAAPPESIAYDVAIQRDGKIVAGGTSLGVGEVGMARYLPDGTFDTSFGANGTVILPGQDAAYALAIQGDGKIIAAGTVQNPATSGDFGLLRLTADGLPDPTFGPGGRIITDFNSTNDRVTGVALQQDGRIVAVGSQTQADGVTSDFAVARYESDTAVLPTFSINDVKVTEGQSGTANATFTVTLSGVVNQLAQTVDYSIADGTATANSDYVPISGTLTFQPGETQHSIVVLIKGDTTYERNETFFVNLSNPSNSPVTTISDPQGKGTIVNDDVLPKIIVHDVAKGEGNSGTSSMLFSVTLSNPSYQTVSVDFSTQNGSATSFEDYILTSGTVTFAPGETSKSVAVSIKGDTKFETNESLQLSAFNPSNATIADGLGIGTILNDDAAPKISISDVAKAEGNSGQIAFTFTVTLSNASYQSVSMNFATTAGTAASGTDYVAASGSLMFMPGETSKTITVYVKGDTTKELNETFFVDLTSPINATFTKSRGTGTITNDD
jgi:uncharacterized delta-60 repeat protein